MQNFKIVMHFLKLIFMSFANFANVNGQLNKPQLYWRFLI